MRSNKWYVWFSLLILLLLAGCGGKEAETEFTRRGMLENVVNGVVLPLNADFVTQTAVLQSAAHTFQTEPTAANLEALQNEWRAASDLWQMAQLYEFDRMMVLHNQIAKTPTDEEFIEDVLARGLTGLDEDFVESVGSTAKGLPAIEYFVFDSMGDDEAVLAQLSNEPARLEYMVGAADNLHSKAQEVQAYWLPEGNGYANTFINADGGGETFNSSVSMLTNQMVAVLEIAIREKLGRPLGAATGEGVQPAFVEAGLSGHSLAHIRRNVESVEQACTGGAGLGLDDYLDYLGAEIEGRPLSEAIAEQFSATYAALDAVEPPLATAVVEDTASVQSAYDELRQLLILIKVDMANQLGVTITFNDSDGD